MKESARTGTMDSWETAEEEIEQPCMLSSIHTDEASPPTLASCCLFSMLKARCPLEDKTACAIKQSGAPLHRIKFENTVSVFETLPGALSPPTLLLDQGCSSLACAWLRHLS
ncbi:PREDICTED: PIR [Prunus dulcis]|uniref:PREDICTED: PIR n=1 Tax=Prunus dulcis TaxID=3755 RepID=A0A5E4F391_PRUDU|nr:hypothetical protein L3X38_034616 [Prunus dulcis]VVA22564.1 PREDICTED: PIR [Prunus dulcis]